jgi:hypothetical protein
MPLKEIPFVGPYTIRYDWDAFEKICESLGIESFADFDIILRKLGPKQIRLMLWAGLLHKFPNLQPSEVGSIISDFMQEKQLPEITVLISNGLVEAGFISMQGADKGETKVNPKQSEK